MADQGRYGGAGDGNGEGMAWIAGGTADGNGNFDFAISGVTEDDLLTATATDTAGNTSQFSYQPALTALEVTQAIQDLQNSVLLIKDKPAFVRAHVGAVQVGSGAEGAPALGELLGRRTGGELPGSPLQVQNQGGSIELKEKPVRFELDDHFLFELPADWLEGDVELEFRNLAFRCTEPANARDNAEPAGAENDCRAGVIFRDSAVPVVTFVPLLWTGEVGPSTFPMTQISSMPPRKSKRPFRSRI